MRLRKYSFLLFFFFPLLFFNRPFSVVIAQEMTPFYSRDANPFVFIFGLPMAESSTLTPVGHIGVGIFGEVVNNFTGELFPDHLVIIDGETYFTTLLLRWGIRQNLEIGMDIPYVFHSTGFLDEFIEQWHDFFGFSNASRRSFKKNQLRYILQYKGKNLIEVNEPTDGLGDIRFFVASQFPRKVALFDSLVWRIGLKLPTGNPKALHGSGSVDGSLSLSGTSHPFQVGVPLQAYGGIGLLMLNQGKIWPAHQYTQIGFGHMGIGAKAAQWLDLKMQLDFHTPFYHGASAQIGSFSVQSLIGGTLQFPNQWFVDVAVSEDIIKDTGPDLAFHMALRRLF